MPNNFPKILEFNIFLSLKMLAWDLGYNYNSVGAAYNGCSC